jgi:hypothetical protein
MKEEKPEPISANYLEKFDQEVERRAKKRITDASSGMKKGLNIFNSVICLFLLTIFAEAMYYRDYDTALNIFRAVGITWGIMYLIDFNKSPSS